MKNWEIAKEAISIALKNGWSPYWKENNISSANWPRRVDSGEYYRLIFDHQFAINFFGKSYKKNLAEMVVYEDPTVYLEKFLPVKKGGRH